MGGFDKIREIKDKFSGRNMARTEVLMSGRQPVKEGRKSIRFWKQQIRRGGRQDGEWGTERPAWLKVVFKLVLRKDLWLQCVCHLPKKRWSLVETNLSAQHLHLMGYLSHVNWSIQFSQTCHFFGHFIPLCLCIPPWKGRKRPPSKSSSICNLDRAISIIVWITKQNQQKNVINVETAFKTVLPETLW